MSRTNKDYLESYSSFATWLAANIDRIPDFGPQNEHKTKDAIFVTNVLPEDTQLWLNLILEDEGWQYSSVNHYRFGSYVAFEKYFGFLKLQVWLPELAVGTVTEEPVTVHKFSLRPELAAKLGPV